MADETCALCKKSLVPGDLHGKREGQWWHLDCYRLNQTVTGDDSALVHRVMMNIRVSVTRPRWATVKMRFGCGATVAKLLCRRFDFDPDEQAPRDRPPAGAAGKCPECDGGGDQCEDDDDDS